MIKRTSMQVIAERVYNEHQIKIDDAIMNSKSYPLTLGILKQFSIVNDEFSKIIESLQSIEHFYSNQAIFRIAIEHFLIAYYIQTKCRLDNNDKCAQDYWEKYPVSEAFKQDNFNSRLDGSFDMSISDLENFYKKSPEFKDKYTTSQMQDLHVVASQFDIRKILKYLETLDRSDPFYKLIDFAMQCCQKYNRLSSFVHGGPSSLLEAFFYSDDNRKKDLIRENIEEIYLFSRNIKMSIIFLLTLENPNFLPIFELVTKKD